MNFGIDKNATASYSLVVTAAKKTPPAPDNAVTAPTRPEDTDSVSFGNTEQASSSYANSQNYLEILKSHQAFNGGAGTDINSIRLQYGNFYESRLSDSSSGLPSLPGQDADGFIYVAGQGLVAYSDAGDVYPTQGEVQKQADEALTQYLQASAVPSAESTLNAMKATGKPLTDEQERQVAEMLKTEAANMKPAELKALKSQISSAYTSLVPDTSAETDHRKAILSGLVSDIGKIQKSQNTSESNKAWLTAVYDNASTPDELASLETELRGEAGNSNFLDNRIASNRQAGKSILYPANREEEFALS